MRDRKLTSTGRGILAFVAATSLFAAPAGADEPALQPLPAPPAFDGTPIEGGEAKDAAVKAIGPLAATFIDRSVDSPYFIGPQDIWVAKFFTKPRVVKPGLCVERMLVVPLRLTRLPEGRTTWQAHNVRWIDQARAVGPFDETERTAPDSKEDAACQDLGYFKVVYGSRVLQADSIADAWRGGLLLQTLVRTAQSKARLGFALKCEPSDDTVCKKPRQSLAKVKLIDLQTISQCEGGEAGKDCLRLSVHTPYGYGQAYWDLTVRSAGPGSARVTAVTMAFDIPPVI